MKWLACFLSLVSWGTISSQSMHLLLDTVMEIDQVALDPIGNLYLYTSSNKVLSKINPHFELMYQTSINKSHSPPRMDVSDPLKPILYYPGEFLIQQLDAQGSILITRDASDLNEYSALAYFDQDRIVIYNGYTLALQDAPSGNSTSQHSRTQIVSSAGTRNDLKKVQDNLYLFQRENGILKFTAELFETHRWLIPGMECADCDEGGCYLILQGSLYHMDPDSGTLTILSNVDGQVKGLAVGAQRMAILYHNRLKLFQKP